MSARPQARLTAGPALLFLHLWLIPVWTAISVLLAWAGFLCSFTAALFRIRNTLPRLRILRTRLWRQQPGGVRLRQPKDGKEGKYAVVVLPDPDRPEKNVSPKEPGLFFKRWERIARNDFDGDLWYAGDPRFAVVLTKPGPRSMGYARRPTVQPPYLAPPPDSAPTHGNGPSPSGPGRPAAGQDSS